MTERLHFHFSLSCIGEGNGNPLQCSCPENPRDGGAWWAAIYGVTQSRTQLKRLSSSNSSSSSGKTTGRGETYVPSVCLLTQVWARPNTPSGRVTLASHFTIQNGTRCLLESFCALMLLDPLLQDLNTKSFPHLSRKISERSGKSHNKEKNVLE